MKKYISFFRLRFAMGLQYRTAALAGVVTQFFWGFMEILVLRAFYEADPTAYPMTIEGTCCYIWLQQAFLALLSVNTFDRELMNCVTDGGIAYELCRPVSVYDMWFARNLAVKTSRAMLRCVPILAVVIFLPEGYGLTAPRNALHFILFLWTLFMGLSVLIATQMIIYMIMFFTLSVEGVKSFFVAVMELLTGAVIPIPFFPEKVQRALELLPFGAMQNVPYRIYSGDLAGTQMGRAVLMQIIWFTVLTALGKILMHRAERRVIVQGG